MSILLIFLAKIGDEEGEYQDDGGLDDAVG
jgi:hypothetical protein